MHERNLVHTTKVNFINNLYTTPIAIEFLTLEFNTSMNLVSKYRQYFATIKVISPSTAIVMESNTVINNPN